MLAAVVDARCRMLRADLLDASCGEWKRVIGSRVLACSIYRYYFGYYLLVVGDGIGEWEDGIRGLTKRKTILDVGWVELKGDGD